MTALVLNPLFYEFRGDDYKHNPYDTAVAWQFRVADALLRNDETVPYHWQYSPGMGDGSVEDGDYYAETIEEFLVEGLIDFDDLRYFGNVLDRYKEWARLAGKDY